MDSRPSASGALLTDIDDTLLPSGRQPDEVWIDRFANVLRELGRSGVLWVGMSGVALHLIRPRILDRLPPELLAHVIYYGGDGSRKYRFEGGGWVEDGAFRRLLSDGQSLLIMGETHFVEALVEQGETAAEAKRRVQSASKAARRGEEIAGPAIIEMMEAVLAENGFDPRSARLYHRGGSISWMMLGDIDPGPYREPKAQALRRQLIDFGRESLKLRGRLVALGHPVGIPFPGARGIKFVVEGNDKERATCDLISTEGLREELLLFMGNELFSGGNDDMLRHLSGVTLLSVGERVDTAENVLDARLEGRDGSISGPEAGMIWLEHLARLASQGMGWREVVEETRRGARPGME